MRETRGLPKLIAAVPGFIIGVLNVSGLNFALTIALVHLGAGQLEFLRANPRSRLLSFASGVSIASASNAAPRMAK